MGPRSTRGQSPRSVIGCNNRATGSETGSVVALVALLLPVFIGMLALVFDNGRLQRSKRVLQDAADAAAVAAALELKRNNSGTYRAIAKQDAAENGVSAPPATIDIYQPPSRGPYSGKSDFVEVVISRPESRLFLAALGVPAKTVVARSVAGFAPDPACIYAMDPSASSSLNISGQGQLSATNCRVHVNSSSSSAANIGGNGLEAASVGIVGDYVGGPVSPQPETGVAVLSDPLASLPAPHVGACDYTKLVRPSPGATLDPGVYCGGITIGKDATFSPGLYVVLGDVNLGANTTVTGHGITFYFTTRDSYAPGSFRMNGGATIDLRAPTSGVYRGILAYTDRTIPYASTLTHKVNGGAEVKLSGTIYSVNQNLEITGSPDCHPFDLTLVVNQLGIGGGSSIFTSAYDLARNQSPYMMSARLVE